MFYTKNLVHNVKDVPSTWIFEHFCKLKEPLIGKDVNIKSIFNDKDKTPSMYIYLKGVDYRYKDFSSGRSGSAIDLVKEIKQISFYEASNLIVELYNDFVLHNNGGYDVKEFKSANRYKVYGVSFRTWSTQDQYFWTQFNIGSKLLEEHYVRPLDYYHLSNDDKELTIKGLYLYGYFKSDGSLYKIYQPKTLDKKFIKVIDYIQGSEQLKGYPYLIVTSSLKDIMALKSLKLSMDIIAPDSENTMIKPDQIKQYIKSYKKVVFLFDNDEPGIASMMKYKKLYPEIEITLLPMSKDPADSIKDYSAKEVRSRIIPIINKKLNGT